MKLIYRLADMRTFLFELFLQVCFDILNYWLVSDDFCIIHFKMSINHTRIW